MLLFEGKSSHIFNKNARYLAHEYLSRKRLPHLAHDYSIYTIPFLLHKQKSPIKRSKSSNRADKVIVYKKPKFALFQGIFQRYGVQIVLKLACFFYSLTKFYKGDRIKTGSAETVGGCPLFGFPKGGSKFIICYPPGRRDAHGIFCYACAYHSACNGLHNRSFKSI